MPRFIVRLMLAACSTLAVAVRADEGPEKGLLDLRGTAAKQQIDATDATWSMENQSLHIAAGHTSKWPGVTIKAPNGNWDLSADAAVEIGLKNPGHETLRLSCRVDNPGADGRKNCVTGSADVSPGEERTLTVRLPCRLSDELQEKLFGMRGYPNGATDQTGDKRKDVRNFDPAKVNQVMIFVANPAKDSNFEVVAMRAVGDSHADLFKDASKFFPMIDQFGQYIHKDWPGKVKSLDDLARHKEEEAADLGTHPGAADWDQYGGWKAGPQRQATGFFRAEKLDGRWWLVDPDGRLFWSNGIDCVRGGNATTAITDREFYFADLPPRDGPFGPFYGTGYRAAHGYYTDKHYTTFNFTGANLRRKFGPDYNQAYHELVHRRLRSWGLNTIGNWSGSEVYLMRKTPYVATLGARGRIRPISGSEGYWGKFADVFDPQFEQALRQSCAAEKGKSAGDPWCLGYFVDNELGWGDEFSLALAALTSPADQPAKKVFVEDLKQKYDTIEKLNAAWGTAHESWDALLQNTTPPDKQKAGDELRAFYSKLAERYFEICNKAVHEVAPNQLYLGCRFAWVNDRAVRAGCKYCDVVSFNRYRRTVADLRLPEGCDKPVIIGEFHLGALDRGMFHTGLVPCANQEDRARSYKAYVESALDNPLLVGVHWFQFGDQATTGRSDGENYQIGFVDVCDTPYAETIAACREVTATMYQRRAKK